MYLLQIKYKAERKQVVPRISNANKRSKNMLLASVDPLGGPI